MDNTFFSLSFFFFGSSGGTVAVAGRMKLEVWSRKYGGRRGGGEGGRRSRSKERRTMRTVTECTLYSSERQMQMLQWGGGGGVGHL